MNFIEGGICAVKGVRAGGIKPGKMGMAVIVGRRNCCRSLYQEQGHCSSPCSHEGEDRKTGRLSAVIVNSGNANAFTGEQGVADAKTMASLLASRLGIDEELIGVGSTGVVGRKLDTEWIDSTFLQHWIPWVRMQMPA